MGDFDEREMEDRDEVTTDGLVPCANCGHPTTTHGKSPDFPLCEACEG